MAGDPFPRSALDANRAGRLTPEQAAELVGEAKQTKRTGLTAGVVLVAFGALLVGGVLTGRIPKSDTLGALGIGAAIAALGAFLLLPMGRSRTAAAESKGMAARVETIEGVLRRERVDRNRPTALDGLLGVEERTSTRNQYDYVLHVGDRRFSVPESTWDAAPPDGIVRAYVLVGADRIVNIERLGDAPLVMPAFAAAIADRLGVALPGTPAAPAATAAANAAAETPQPDSPAALAAAITGHWSGTTMPLTMIFGADGTVEAGMKGDLERQPWEVAGPATIGIDGHPWQVRFEGPDVLFVSPDPRAPVMRLERRD